ncbi:DUF6777 domain-containing protein [Streptomyces sp. E11-3]|uniref:DUF6777 domain-containing protein n=1 Tax=Streptomyces sp. E11-3 TaxID=3110112 RepID=UPI00397F8F04
MSSQPPPSDRPTGPPSGPLSGGRPGPAPEAPTELSPTPPPGSVPPEPPTGGGGGGSGGGSGGGGTGGGDSGGGKGGGPEGPAQGPGEGPGEGPGTPWWRSVPKVAGIAAAIVAATVLVIVLTRPDDGGKGGGASGSEGEVFLQAASATGVDPFTESSEPDSRPSAPPPTLPSAPETDTNVTRSVEGSAPGLYGGTRNIASCDVEQQISTLTAEPDKNKAFASVPKIEASEVPSYLRSLTPLQLRMDTRVTNHGYKNGAATSYQAVLQAGTAVLVDEHGVPRVRCACGNPLTPPVALRGDAERKGNSWPEYRPSNVVAVAPAPQVVNVFVILDLRNGKWFEREKGDTGEKDKPTTPPTSEPSPTTTTQSPSPSPTLCPSGTTPSPTTGATPDATTTCVPVTASPTSPSPTDTSPTDTSPTDTSPTDETGPPTDGAGTDGAATDTQPGPYGPTTSVS